jgi:sec-independent protein translocase protein TatB
MFDIGMSELLIVGIVALIVVGPKDLPGMFRTLGRFTAKIKAMGREFTRAMEAAADDAGVNDIKSTLNAAANPAKFGLNKLKDAATGFENWDPMKDKAQDGADAPEAELDEDRAEAARQIQEATAQKATERKAAEAAAEVKTKADPVTKAPVKKAAAKKPAAKKAPAKKVAPKKASVAKSTAAKKPATPKTPAKKTPASKAKAAAPKTEDKA